MPVPSDAGKDTPPACIGRDGSLTGFMAPWMLPPMQEPRIIPPPAERDPGPSDAGIVVLFALSLLLWLVGDRLRAGDNAEPYLFGASGVAWYVLAAMLIAWIAARLSDPRVTYRHALFLVAAFAPFTIATFWLLAAVNSRTLFRLVLALLLVCGGMFLAWGLRRVSGRLQLRAVLVSLIAAIGIGWASEVLYVHPTAWYAPEKGDTRAEWESGERLLFEQPERIDRAVGKLGARDSGGPNVFFVGFAGYGEQRVFANEIELAERVVGERYGSASRSVLLVNDQRDQNEYPLATVSGLRRTLRAIGERMDRDQDILFLALSSHGSEGAELAVSNGALPLGQLSGAELAAALDDAGIRWRVIVISACFSGAFIPSLQDDRTIVLAASSPNRTSFGCSDDRDLTYFGEAFFRDALPPAASLREAFAQARARIAEREQQEGIEPSYPQGFFGAAIERRLRLLAQAGHSGGR